MLTKAGKQALQVFYTWTTRTDTQNEIPMFPSASIRDISNNERWVSYVNTNLLSSTDIKNNLWSGFHIGSGTTTPTENDYKLETQITSGFTGTLSYAQRGIDNGSLYMEFGLLITNTGTVNFTIAEVGLVTNNIRVCTSSSATSVTSADIMIDRTVLTTAVTLAVGESKLIKYRITTSISFS